MLGVSPGLLRESWLSRWTSFKLHPNYTDDVKSHVCVSLNEKPLEVPACLGLWRQLSSSRSSFFKGLEER